MSRVHDALRKASQESYDQRQGRSARSTSRAEVPPPPPRIELPATLLPAETASVMLDVQPGTEDLEDIIRIAREIPFNPLKEALVVNPSRPREAPGEEFRSLRTRLNHLQTLQPLHTLVVTSASPAEGKSFTAANLAITQSQLADKRVLLADFDFRRPSVHSTFQI